MHQIDYIHILQRTRRHTRTIPKLKKKRKPAMINAKFVVMNDELENFLYYKKEKYRKL